MKVVVVSRIDKQVMIRLDCRYNQLDILSEDTAAGEGIADSYCPTEAAVVERNDWPSHTLHDC